MLEDVAGGALAVPADRADAGDRVAGKGQVSDGGVAQVHELRGRQRGAGRQVADLEPVVVAARTDGHGAELGEGVAEVVGSPGARRGLADQDMGMARRQPAPALGGFLRPFLPCFRASSRMASPVGDLDRPRRGAHLEGLLRGVGPQAVSDTTTGGRAHAEGLPPRHPDGVQSWRIAAPVFGSGALFLE